MVKHEKDCFITLFKTPTNELQNKANFIIAIYLDTLLCMSFQRIHIRVGEVIDADECLTEVSSFNRVRFTTVFFFLKQTGVVLKVEVQIRFPTIGLSRTTPVMQAVVFEDPSDSRFLSVWPVSQVKKKC